MKICLVFLKRFNQSLHHIYFCSCFSKNVFIYFWDRISYCSSIGLELAGSTRLALNSHTSTIPAYTLGVLRLRHVMSHPVYFCLFKISFLNQDLVQLPTLSGNFACSPGWPWTSIFLPWRVPHPVGFIFNLFFKIVLGQESRRNWLSTYCSSRGPELSSQPPHRLAHCLL